MGKRKLILYTAVSVDGYIAEPDGSVDWLAMGDDEDYDFPGFMDQVDDVILGYNTYEKACTFPGNPFKNKVHYVVTTRMNPRDDDRVIFMNSDFQAFISQLQAQKNRKDIWVMGGGKLIQSIVSQNVVINDWYLFVIPIVLGGGIPLFPSSFPKIKLQLSQVKSFNNGVVLLKYHQNA